jgi:hypothetical protein
MTGLVHQGELPIAGFLEQCTEEVRPAGHNRWKFELSAAVSLTVTARLDKQWLRLRAPLARSTKRLTPELLERLLGQNGELDAGAKFTLADDPLRLYVSAEIPLDEDQADLGAGVARICEGFRQAAEKFAAGQRPSDANPDGVPLAGIEEPCGALDRERLALCEEAGWPLARRAGDQVAIELDVPGSFCQALVQPKGERGLHLRVDLATVPSACDAGRHAIGALLLHASHLVRMARATSRTAGGDTVYRWEVSLDRGAGVRAVQHALSALSVACRLTAREIQVFEQDQSIARGYLVLRQWTS